LVRCLFIAEWFDNFKKHFVCLTAIYRAGGHKVPITTLPMRGTDAIIFCQY